MNENVFKERKIHHKCKNGALRCPLPGTMELLPFPFCCGWLSYLSLAHRRLSAKEPFPKAVHEPRINSILYSCKPVDLESVFVFCPAYFSKEFSTSSIRRAFTDHESTEIMRQWHKCLSHACLFSAKVRKQDFQLWREMVRRTWGTPPRIGNEVR